MGRRSFNKYGRGKLKIYLDRDKVAVNLSSLFLFGIMSFSRVFADVILYTIKMTKSFPCIIGP